MPLQATSGAASYDGFGGGVAVEPVYIEQIFSTYLYTGNGSTQTITNGIDLAGKGGLFWIKKRNLAESHFLTDTARGGSNQLQSNATAAQTYYFPSTFLSNGVELYGANSNDTNDLYASWTFRKQAKFFDVVTFTSDGTTSQAISHSLGSAPGFIVIKRTDASQSWIVWHRGNGTTNYYTWSLNNTAAAASTSDLTAYMTSTSFQPNRLDDYLGNRPVSGGTYVAYLFAHNAGGFGLTGTDNVISCGSYTGNGSTTGPTVTLGYEPQWLLVKNAGATGNWFLFDNMRGIPTGGDTSYLTANLATAEGTALANAIDLSATGFQIKTTSAALNTSGSAYIYIAIRRGPMKVPTSGTSVFSPITYVGTSANATISSSVRPDVVISKYRSGSAGAGEAAWFDRLRGPNKFLASNGSLVENTVNTDTLLAFLNQSYTLGADGGAGVINFGSQNYVNYALTRAPSFMDVVCYTGTGVARTVTHNLGVAPELMIIKDRTNARSWRVYAAFNGATRFTALNTTAGYATSSNVWNDTAPTSSVFTVGIGNEVNFSGDNFVAYLFATCAGVQYINSYVGDGTTGRTINCGFTGGARFVCIKATSTTGSWWTFDSARGIVTNNDPALQLNSTAAEVTSADAIDTASSGFIVNQEATCSLNASGVTYLVWAIA
jgi:hypothetical protein